MQQESATADQARGALPATVHWRTPLPSPGAPGPAPAPATPWSSPLAPHHLALPHHAPSHTTPPRPHHCTPLPVDWAYPPTPFRLKSPASPPFPVCQAGPELRPSEIGSGEHHPAREHKVVLFCFLPFTAWPQTVITIPRNGFRRKTSK